MPGTGGPKGIAAVCVAVAVAVATAGAGAVIATPAVAVPAQQPPPEYEIPDGPLYMEPFPVVRIRGELARGGARVRLLQVTAGRRAVVRVRCKGRGCPCAACAASPAA